MGTNFNPAQLATIEEAREIARLINSTPMALTDRDPEPIGGGILPESKDPKLSGIYDPVWLTVNEPTAPPSSDRPGALFLHFRFANGCDAINVGLVREQFKRYPSAPLYVLRQLRIEVADLATGKAA